MKNISSTTPKENTITTILKNNENKEPLYNNITTQFIKRLQIDNFAGVQPMNAPVGTVSTMEWKNTKEGIVLDVIDHVVTAQTRKMQISMTTEFIQNVQQPYNADCVQSVSYAVADEMADETQSAMCNIMYQNSANCYDFRLEVDDDPQTNVLKLLDASNDIAIRSKRGVANVWILPTDLYASLTPIFHQTSFEREHNPPTTFQDIQYMGTFNKQHKIFVSHRNTVALLMYKGNASDTIATIDAGLIFQPYQLIPYELESNQMGFMLRYNWFKHPKISCYFTNIQVR
jgi:hypothetical protein